MHVVMAASSSPSVSRHQGVVEASLNPGPGPFFEGSCSVRLGLGGRGGCSQASQDSSHRLSFITRRVLALDHSAEQGKSRRTWDHPRIHHVIYEQPKAGAHRKPLPAFLRWP